MEEETFEKRENQAMDEEKVAQAGSFCWDEACTDYGQVGKGNIIKNGKTDKGVQRYRCQTCKKTFTETKGTLLYRCRHSEEEIVECLAMVGDRNSLAAIHRMKGIKEETVCRWMERAATQVEQIEEELVRPKKLSRVQMDALWAYVGHKGEKGGGQKKMHEGHFGEEPR
jgi:transposase-like protein